MTASGRIVAIGASAGGLESLEQLFAMIPPTTGMAFIVVQHLSPEFRSLMDEILARHTEMPVEMARDGQPLEADHVYVLPPRKQMIVRGRRLLLTDRPGHAFQLPIDTFFRALAQDVGEAAVAVVLSGTGSDGSRGIIDIKDAGGFVLAETAGSAKFDGMPKAALATGVVDLARSPRELGRIVAGLSPLDDDLRDLPLADRTPSEGILALLHERFGIDFSQYRTTTVSRRILRRIGFARVPSVADYVAHLRATPGELDALYRDLLIGVTQFFRDPEAFDALAREVIPKILDMVPADEDIRVWVAGCATGEEAYTVAILFLDALTAARRPSRLRVIATDAHERSLDIAAAGVYPFAQLANCSDERLAHYFIQDGDQYRVSPELRQSVMFTRHDVTRDPPFTRIHLVTCRNMLIYLRPAAQKTVLSLFHFGLAPSGFMMLGASENAGSLGDELGTLDARWRLYQKRREIPLVTDVKLSSRAVPDVASELTGNGALIEMYDQLLDLFMPPGLLVDENRNLVDSFAGAERLLRARARRPSQHVLEMLDGELRIIVGSALQRVLDDGVPVSFTNVEIDLDGPARCTIVARRLPGTARGPRHVIVTFRDITRATEPAALAHGEEMRQTRHQLDVARSQLAISTEQLQAANEEMQASNEELQASNEELHAVNEELFTVNAEHQRQIGELRQLDADVLQLLEGSEIGTLFLDPTLRIRRFTARVARLFRFQPTDVGRHLADFAHTLVRPQLIEELAQVLATGAPVTGDLRDDEGNLYFLRILRITGGLVLTLLDITALDRARRHATT